LNISAVLLHEPVVEAARGVTSGKIAGSCCLSSKDSAIDELSPNELQEKACGGKATKIN